MKRLRDERDLTIPAHRARHAGRHGRLGAGDGVRNGEKIAEASRPRSVPTRASSRPTSESRAERWRCSKSRTYKTYYGNIQALKGVSLTVGEGEIVTLIGSNGAGKSTTLRSIAGISGAAQRLDPVPR